MHVLPFVEEQHGAQVADTFVGEPRTGRQLEALQLAKVGRVAEHVYVQQLGNVPAPPHRVLLAERAPDVGALLVHHGPLLGRRPRRPNLPDEVAQTGRCRHSHCGEGMTTRAGYLGNVKEDV